GPRGGLAPRTLRGGGGEARAELREPPRYRRRTRAGPSDHLRRPERELRELGAQRAEHWRARERLGPRLRLAPALSRRGALEQRAEQLARLPALLRRDPSQHNSQPRLEHGAQLPVGA